MPAPRNRVAEGMQASVRIARWRRCRREDHARGSDGRRTPEGVRGLLSAYHRGVQRGRTKEQSTNPEGTPGGQQSSQAGKELEA